MTRGLVDGGARVWRRAIASVFGLARCGCTLVLEPMPEHPGFFLQAGFSASQPGVAPDEIKALGEHGFVFVELARPHTGA